jgi:acetoin utilization deacetylase AcuC-like enzyme
LKTTAFVSHHDCPRHDTGWNNPDHQGRLPAVARAVYRDMLTLFEPLLELEAVPATEADLRLVHTQRHIDAVRGVSAQSAADGVTLLLDGVPVSGASWDAALAAAGTGITGADAVLAGEVRNAFCTARPPGRGATADHAGELSLFNNVAIAARHLCERRGVGRILVTDWGIRPPLATAELLAGDDRIILLSIHQQHDVSVDAEPPTRPESIDSSRWIALPVGSDGSVFADALKTALATIPEDAGPDIVLLAAGFDVLAGEPLGQLAVQPDDVYDLTRIIRDWADARCGGKLVLILEGGYGKGVPRAVVQHLRALAGLEQA